MKKADNFKHLYKIFLYFYVELIMMPEFRLKQYIKVIAGSNLVGNNGPLKRNAVYGKKLKI